MTDKIELTRRKILASMGAVGAAGAGAGLGTSALFSDEESFSNNTIRAGTLDMAVSAEVVAANGEYETAVGAVDYLEEADGEIATGLSLDDVKPGDWVIVCYDISVQDNPGCVTITSANLTDYEDGLTDPEGDVDDTASGDAGDLGGTLDGAGEGDLGANLVAEIYGQFDASADDNPPRSHLSGIDDTTPVGTTLDAAESTYSTGVTVGGGTALYSQSFYLLLYLPTEVGNVVQSDAVDWDLTFDAIQARNNPDCALPGEAPPERDEPDAVSITASPDTAGETDSVHRLEIPVGSGLDGTTLSSITVDYPSDFDVGSVGPSNVLGAGVQRTDSSIDSLSVSGTSASDGDTAIAFSLGGSVSVSSGEAVFIEYETVTNASTPDEYTVVVDVNGSEIGPGTLTLTPDSGTAQPVTSDFDSGDEGWEITGDAQGGSAVPTYDGGEGNPAPSISATDDVQGGVWYFKAPGKFLSDKSDFYGGTLEYDLQQESDLSNQFSARDIILEGGGIQLNYRHGGTSTHPPDGSFQSYSVILDETDDWTRESDGATATQSDIETVLGDLTELRIRGEYEDGPDKGWLDNASMSP